MSNEEPALSAHHESLRRFLRAWIDQECSGMTARAAKRLGLSVTLVRDVVVGDRAPGLRLLVALADRTGRSIDELVGRTLPHARHDVPPSTFGSDPRWKRAEHNARRKYPSIPRAAFRAARKLSGVELSEITPETVMIAAMLGLHLCGDPESSESSEED